MMALRKKKGDGGDEPAYGSSGSGGRGSSQTRGPSPYEQGPSAGGYVSATTKLGELLLAAQAVSPEQLAEVLAKQSESGGKRLGELLVDLKIVNEGQLAAALAEQSGLELVDLSRQAPEEGAIALLPEDVARANDALPGGAVTAALFETTVYLVGQHMAQYAVTGSPAAPMPARVSAWAIYDVFTCRDGAPLFVGVVTDALWAKFCALFGLDELWADEGLRENNARVLARDRILPIVRARLGQYDRDDLIARLEGTGLPFAPIGRPEELFDDPHLAASGALEAVTLTGGAETRLPALPIGFDGGRPAAPATLPEAGADTRSVLRGLGYDDRRIMALLESGAAEEAA